MAQSGAENDLIDRLNNTDESEEVVVRERMNPEETLSEYKEVVGLIESY
jgi:hypothetical protein